MAAPALQTDLRTAAEERYLSYALSVITARALPDVRDGLKPVQRRILFAMHQNLHLGPDARPRKSAAVVGEVLGKYHPHGDQAAYEALVRMAQPFSLRYPLVHGEGNFGSLDGDAAAAMRYTEARLTSLAEEMLADIAAETVPFRANYDATLAEPAVLPARIPQLLVNGAAGIAVGMATSIPPHNLGETVDALVAMIDDPEIDTRRLLRHIRGPDFPTGGELVTGRGELRRIYESGQGTVRVRGQYAVERLPRGKRQVVVNSIPYGVNKAQLVERVGELIATRKLPQATDVRDESTEGVRIVIELKGDAPAEVAMAYLYKHTDLQANFHVNLTCLLPTVSPLVGQPARVALRDLCRHFLDFRMAVVTRRLEHEKRRLEERLHILDGLATIHAQLDAVLRMIRRAGSRADAAAKLTAAFRLDQPQVDAILETRLYQLARLEIEKVAEEREAKRRRLEEIERQLARPRARWRLVREELEAIREKYADARRTALAAGEELVYDPDAYVVHEETTVVLSRDGWVKRVRELRDPAATRLREGDALFAVLRGSTRDRLAVFTTLGGLYVLRVAHLPPTTGYGEPIHSLIRLQDAERVVAAFLVPAAEGGPPPQAELFGEGGERGPVVVLANFLLATRRGYGFRFTPDLSETTRSGRRVARVAAGDAVASVAPVEGDEVVCATSRGKMLRFRLDEVVDLAGPGRGVILLRPGAEAELVGALCPPAGEKLGVRLEDGHTREISLEQVPVGRRAGRGLRVVKRGTVVGLQRRAAEAL